LFLFNLTSGPIFGEYYITAIDTANWNAASVGSFNELDPVYTSSQAANITATDINNLSNLSGVNTGDQDISGIAINTQAIQDTASQIRADIPDVSGFISSEADPVYTSSEAANITATDITNLSNLSGVNTGDQDISGIAINTQAIQDTASQIRADIPDVSGFISSETDPVYTGSQAANITATDITNLSNLSGVNTGDQDISGIAINTQAIQDTASQIRADIPDVSGFISSETDPVYTSSQAANITATDITNLSNLSGVNTGDQDISGIAINTQAIQDTASQIRADIPDVSGFISNETDPVYTGSQAANITATDITNLSNLSGVNTGDQDISGIAINTQAIQDTAAQIRADIPDVSVFITSETDPVYNSMFSITNPLLGDLLKYNGTLFIQSTPNILDSIYIYNSKTGVKLTPNNAAANVDLVLQPKGYGAIIAQQPDGTAAGGNNRGENAVDLQMYRYDATQVASGDYSIIIGGKNNKATASNSLALGFENTASTNLSVAIGGRNTASGNLGSLALGFMNTASGQLSTALGTETTASAPYATTLGHLTTANGLWSTAMGKSSISSGQYAFAMGNVTTASGYAALAMGDYTTASGRISTAFGNRTTAPSAYETVIGRYNSDYTPSSTTDWITTDRLFVVGNGASDVTKTNALTILKNANTTIGGSLTINGNGTDASVTFPTTRGTNGQVLKTNADGTTEWANAEEAGTQAGEMKYWDSTAWTTVDAGEEGDILTFVGGKPVWCYVSETITHNGLEYKTVRSITGQIWLDRNLGASQVATSSTDVDSYGDLYQWGRGTDGHESRTSGTTTTLSTTDSPIDGNFIINPSSPYDWRNPQSNILWQGVSGTNNPCPSGYRLPTDAELEAERASWSSNNAAGAFASPLKLPMGGGRRYMNGTLYGVGINGGYWSSTVDGVNIRRLYFGTTDANIDATQRAGGVCVRCIKD